MCYNHSVIYNFNNAAIIYKFSMDGIYSSNTLNMILIKTKLKGVLNNKKNEN